MKTTIFNTTILALLAIFVAACGDAHNVNVNPDSGVPDGSVDECESVVSCDDPLADECGLECPDPVSFCNLGVPNRFIPNGCGFNDRGELEQRCIFSLEHDDYVWDDVECVDPDECEDGGIPTDYEPLAERLTSCGLNDRGHLALECINGAWEDTAECIDPDDCVDGNETEPVPCGLNNRGQQISTCVEGSWVENDCIDPDECVDGDTKSPVVCGKNGLGTISESCENGTWIGECVFSDYETYITDFGAGFYLDGYDSLSAVDEFEQTLDNSAAFVDYLDIFEWCVRTTIAFWIDRIDGGDQASYMFLGNKVTTPVTTIWNPTVSAACSGPHGEGGECAVNENVGGLYNADNLGGGFHHVVFAVDSCSASKKAEIYLDGALAHSVDIETRVGVQNILVLGRDTLANYKHVAAFNYILSADEVLDLYNYGH